MHGLASRLPDFCAFQSALTAHPFSHQHLFEGLSTGSSSPFHADRDTLAHPVHNVTPKERVHEIRGLAQLKATIDGKDLTRYPASFGTSQKAHSPGDIIGHPMASQG